MSAAVETAREATMAARFWSAPQRALFAERYWHKADAPDRHRLVLLRALREVGEFGSALEVGCNAGPNLRLIHRHWPGVTLAGVDINADVLAFGAAQALAEGWAFETHCGPMQAVLPGLASESVDVVLSAYGVAYVPPGDVAPVLRDMLRVARKAVILAEPMAMGRFPEGPVALALGEHRHDYGRILRSLDVRGVAATVFAVEPPVDRLNAVLLLRASA